MTRLAKAGLEEPTREELVRSDQRRADKKLSSEQWESPTDPDARISKLKDGRLHLAHKAELVESFVF